jgi:hypothetical protein
LVLWLAPLSEPEESFLITSLLRVIPTLSALVTSHSPDNQEVFELTRDNHSDYCKRHGYTYIPNEEPYSWYIDPKYAAKVLDDHEYVFFIGCDLFIQRPSTTLEELSADGVAMCRELKSGLLNGDSIIFKHCDNSYKALDWLLKNQHKYPHTQSALNALCKEQPELVHNVPYTQIAFPEMNPSIDYRPIDLDKYFALHFFTLGKQAVIKEKIRFLKSYAKDRK